MYTKTIAPPPSFRPVANAWPIFILSYTIVPPERTACLCLVFFNGALRATFFSLVVAMRVVSKTFHMNFYQSWTQFVTNTYCLAILLYCACSILIP